MGAPRIDIPTLYDEYIADVTAGRIVVGELVRLAVERHLQDLERVGDPDFPFYFSRTEANRSIGFVRKLRHTKGKYGRKHFDLQPFQAFELAMIFGWLCIDTHTRRFLKAYNETARKSGKSEKAAAIALACFYIDGEYGAEVVSVATTSKQARLVFDAAKKMARGLRKDFPTSAGKRLTVRAHDILYEQDSDIRRFEPLSSDGNTNDGGSPHCAIIDEYHAHPTDEMYNVVSSGMGERPQPLLYVITTAGFNLASPCYQMRLTAIQILRREKVDERFFALIFTLDDGDDWHDETTWPKANPNQGRTPSLEWLRAEYQTAITLGGTAMVNFRTKNLNQWLASAVTWIPLEKWRACGGLLEPFSLYGRPCYGGLDLANTSDIVAFALFFPRRHEGERHALRVWYWLPREQAEQRQKMNLTAYSRWAEQGWIQLTDKPTSDHERIEADIKRLVGQFNVQRIDFDPWGAWQFAPRLAEPDTATGWPGIDMHELSQTIGKLNAPTKELYRIVMDGELNHGSDPVLEWMLGNVVITRDTNNNERVHKGKANEKIDGISATINAIAGWMTATAEPPAGESYLLADGAELEIF